MIFLLKKFKKSVEDLQEMADEREMVNEIVREAITLIYPGSTELADRLPSPPLRDENVLIFTDDRQGENCSTCETLHLINPLALEQAMLNRYGPTASAQIHPEQISSFTFTDLANFLQTEALSQCDFSATVEANTEDTPPVESQNSAQNENFSMREHIIQADWIIFNMLDIDEGRYPNSGAVRQFLRSKDFDLRGKKVIVLAFDAPYYLDNTEVSILTAYYGLYGKTPKYIDTAARLIFREFEATGKSPVSIDAVEYNLISALEPNPNQLITLDVFKTAGRPTSNAASLARTTLTPPIATRTAQAIGLDIEVGDRLTLKTGLIRDKNGNAVPDNTLVAFNLAYPAEALRLAPIIIPTKNGSAQTIITVEREGILEITAESGQALQSEKYVIGGPTLIIETPLPTTTPPPTPTFTPSALPTEPTIPTLTPIPSPTLNSMAVAGISATGPVLLLSNKDLTYTLISLSFFGLLVFGVLWPFRLPLEKRIWPVLLIFSAGLIAYVLYGIFAIRLLEMNLIGPLIRFNAYNHWLTPLLSVACAALSLGLITLGRLALALYRQIF